MFFVSPAVFFLPVDIQHTPCPCYILRMHRALVPGMIFIGTLRPSAVACIPGIYNKYQVPRENYLKGAVGRVCTTAVPVPGVFLAGVPNVPKCQVLKLYRLFEVVVVVVLTLTHHGYNAVRGHRTGSNNSGAEDYLRRKNK